MGSDSKDWVSFQCTAPWVQNPMLSVGQQPTKVLNYSYRLDGVKLSGGNYFLSIKNAS